MEIGEIDLLKKLKESNIELRSQVKSLQKDNSRLHKINHDLRKQIVSQTEKLKTYGLGRNNQFVVSTNKGLVKPYQIQAIIERMFNLPYKGIMVKSQSPKYSLPRQYFIYLVRFHTHLSLKAIAKKLGGFDHTTMVHAEKKIHRLLFIEKKQEALAIFEEAQKHIEETRLTGKTYSKKKKMYYANNN